MKVRNPIYLLLTLCFFVSTIAAQELVREEAQWNIWAVYWSFPPFQETISVKLEGDTLIDDYTYKKVYESRDSLNEFWEPTDEYLREDDTQKVYLLKDGEEILLYDFNLMIGDTFHINYEAWEGCDYLVVMEIDSVTLFNGETRKRWTLENDGGDPDNIWGITTHWIEGIGSNFGLMRYITEQHGCWEHYPYNLLCYSNAEDLVLSTNEGESCWITPVEELSKEEDGISVFPNPASGNVFIKSEQADRSIETVKLFSAAGQLLTSMNVHSNTGTLALSNYEDGAYYLLIEDSFGIKRSARIIKLE